MIFQNNHITICYKQVTEAGSLIKLPEAGSTMKFKNYKTMIERPFMSISDLESTLLKRKSNKLDNNGKQKHIPK